VTVAVVLVALGMAAAFARGYAWGERRGIEAARLVGGVSLQRERARCGELVREARVAEQAKAREWCEDRQLGRIYGARVISRPSMAGSN